MMIITDADIEKVEEKLNLSLTKNEKNAIKKFRDHRYSGVCRKWQNYYDVF